MDAGEKMIRDVEQTLKAETPTTFEYTGMDYGAVAENREKQLTACQKLRDRHWKVHACAMAIENFETDFIIAATRNNSTKATEFEQEYQRWKDYKKKWSCSIYEWNIYQTSNQKINEHVMRL